MPYTRASMLAHALRFALGKLRIRGYKRLLTDDDRAKIADDVVDQLQRAGWDLSEHMPDPGPGTGRRAVGATSRNDEAAN